MRRNGSGTGRKSFRRWTSGRSPGSITTRSCWARWARLRCGTPCWSRSGVRPRRADRQRRRGRAPRRPRRAVPTAPEAAQPGSGGYDSLWRLRLARTAGVAGAVTLVPLRPFQQRVQREHRVVDAGVQVAQLGEPGGNGRDRALPGDDGVDLAPGDRGGHGPLGNPANRVRGSDRVVAGVLVVVDEELPGIAILAPPGGRHILRRPALDLAGEGQRGPPEVGETPSGFDPHIDVHARPARRLGPPDRAQFIHYLMGNMRDPADGVEIAVRHRVKVDPPLVGSLRIRAPGVPRVELPARG